MVDVDEYLRRAERAVTLMEREHDPDARAALERAAKTWLRTAEAQMDQLLSERAAAEASTRAARIRKPRAS